MGCDIHFVIERRRPAVAGDKWLGIYASDRNIGDRPTIARRNYDFFTEVAAVRGQSPTQQYPQNIPEDVSNLAWQEYMAAPTDHHSASHMSAADFVSAYRRAEPLKDESRAPYDTYDLLGVDDFEGEYEFRVVFWFDN
jgi:hypothetical protein